MASLSLLSGRRMTPFLVGRSPGSPTGRRRVSAVPLACPRPPGQGSERTQVRCLCLEDAHVSPLPSTRAVGLQAEVALLRVEEEGIGQDLVRPWLDAGVG